LAQGIDSDPASLNPSGTGETLALPPGRSPPLLVLRRCRRPLYGGGDLGLQRRRGESSRWTRGALRSLSRRRGCGGGVLLYGGGAWLGVKRWTRGLAGAGRSYGSELCGGEPGSRGGGPGRWRWVRLGPPSAAWRGDVHGQGGAAPAMVLGVVLAMTSAFSAARPSRSGGVAALLPCSDGGVLWQWLAR
jgi:hypothetical protein